MLILAFESSAKPASAALVRDGRMLAQTTQISALTHSRTLLPMAEDLLKNCSLTLGDVDVIAVAHGPGSFTGIRIGVSTVKGLAWGADKPCVGVSTLEAMAWHGLAAGGMICPVMDARRSQVYNALFRIADGRPVRLCADRAISLEDLAAELAGYEENVFLIGDGAAMTKAYLDGCGIPCTLAPDNLVWQERPFPARSCCPFICACRRRSASGRSVWQEKRSNQGIVSTCPCFPLGGSAPKGRQGQCEVLRPPPCRDCLFRHSPIGSCRKAARLRKIPSGLAALSKFNIRRSRHEQRLRIRPPPDPAQAFYPA